MPLNLNTRRPPPPPPDDEPVPPPVPFRPQTQKPATNNRAPSPPLCTPPALPQRPGGRNNQPVVELEPPEIEEENYEDITSPPVLVPQRLQKTIGYHGKNVIPPKTPPKVATKSKTALRPWDSFKEVGNKPSKKSSSDSNATSNDAAERKRRVTLGARPQQPEPLASDDEMPAYETPQDLASSIANRQHTAPVADNRSAPVQRRDSSEDLMSTEDQEPGDEIYELPEESDPRQMKNAANHAAPDKVTADADNRGVGMTINTADIQMGRMRLNSNPSCQPLSPTSVTKEQTVSPTTGSSSAIGAFKKMFEQKNIFGNNNKPTPPPKPKDTDKNKPPITERANSNKKNSSNTTTTTNNTTTTTTPDKDKLRRDSRSDDNASAGSVSSTKGSQLKVDNKKKDKTAMVPKTTTPASASAAKVPILPVDLMHDLKDRVQTQNATNDVESRKPVNSVSPPKPSRLSVAEPAEDDIYDEGVSMSEVLTRYDWFHGDIDRKEGEKRIQSVGKIGTFLIRTSSGNNKAPDGNQFPYTLVVKTKNSPSKPKDEIKNLRIRYRLDNNYAIGSTERSDEIFFPHVFELVEHHRENHVKIFGQDNSDGQDEKVKLIATPKKS